MKYTKSGAMAVGAPWSQKRFENEAINAFANGTHLLEETQEGREMLRRIKLVVPEPSCVEIQFYLYGVASLLGNK